MLLKTIIKDRNILWQLDHLKIRTRYNFWKKVITKTREKNESRVEAVLEKIKVQAEESPRLIKKSIHIFAFQDRGSSAPQLKATKITG